MFTLSSSVCDSRNLYRDFLFYVFRVFSDLTLAVRLHSLSKFKRLKMFRFLLVALRVLQVVVGALVTNTLLRSATNYGFV